MFRSVDHSFYKDIFLLSPCKQLSLSFQETLRRVEATCVSMSTLIKEGNKWFTEIPRLRDVAQHEPGIEGVLQTCILPSHSDFLHVVSAL